MPAGRGDTVRMEYVSRVPRPPLDELIDDLNYLEGAPPYARLTLPPPSTLPGASTSGGGSCANIPATCWTAGRCQPIDFLQERQLTTR